MDQVASVKALMSLTQGDNGLMTSKDGIASTSLSNSKVPVLNFDVVDCIMVHSNRPTISRLMETCHQYHSIGVPRLLRNVHLLGFEIVDSFHDFMFATSATDRFRFLRNLTIWETQDSPFWEIETRNGTPQLKILRILSHSTHLEKVALWNVKSMLDKFPGAYGHPKPPSTFQEKESERSGFRGMLDRFGQLKVPLPNLSLTLDGEDTPVRLLVTISRFYHILCALSMGNPCLDAIDAGIQFRQVSKLIIGSIDLTTPSSCYSASTILGLFPNLKTLIFPNDSYDGNALDILQRDIEKEHHEHMVEAARDGVVDRILQVFEGCADDLYRGAYICRINKLYLHYLDDMATPWLGPLLIHIQPSVLSLDFRVCDSGPTTIGIITSILQEPSTCNTLQHLFLVCDAENSENGFIRSVLEGLPEMLRLTSITTFKITYSFASTEFEDIDFFTNVRVNWEEIVIQTILAVPSITSMDFVTRWEIFRKLYQIPENLVNRARQEFQDEAAVYSYVRSEVRNCNLVQ